MHSFQGVTAQDSAMLKDTGIQFGESGRSPRTASMAQAHLAAFVVSFVPGPARSPLHMGKTKPGCFSLFRFPRNLIVFVERNVEGDCVRQQIQPLQSVSVRFSSLFVFEESTIREIGKCCASIARIYHSTFPARFRQERPPCLLRGHQFWFFGKLETNVCAPAPGPRKVAKAIKTDHHRPFAGITIRIGFLGPSVKSGTLACLIRLPSSRIFRSGMLIPTHELSASRSLSPLGLPQPVQGSQLDPAS